MFGEDQRVGDWCAARIPYFAGWGVDPKTIGYEVDGQLKGGAVWTNYTPTNVVQSLVLEAPLTKRFLYAMFFIPFRQYKVRHLGCAIEESNVRSINLATRLGFIAEGRLRQAASDGGDVIVMGMLETECRFLAWGLA